MEESLGAPSIERLLLDGWEPRISGRPQFGLVFYPGTSSLVLKEAVEEGVLRHGKTRREGLCNKGTASAGLQPLPVRLLLNLIFIRAFFHNLLNP
jgi:hypothetical protein